jgi:hypothetical protein
MLRSLLQEAFFVDTLCKQDLHTEQDLETLLDQCHETIEESRIQEPCNVNRHCQLDLTVSVTCNPLRSWTGH